MITAGKTYLPLTSVPAYVMFSNTALLSLDRKYRHHSLVAQVSPNRGSSWNKLKIKKLKQEYAQIIITSCILALYSSYERES